MAGAKCREANQSRQSAIRVTAKSTAVWRWQQRFAADGADGLLRDKTRLLRIAPFGPAIGERIVAMRLAEKPGEATE
ncbi:hypothetical protein [Phreatobacter sp.]|uniref:hypothetical protein n=1 Tax=Phreatobacter sp. TaxID=1966341 RepID=UPI0025D90206|nr:hypothetical protein [Phreatobacter sp.]